MGLCTGGGAANILKQGGRKNAMGEDIVFGSVVDAENDLICHLVPDAEEHNTVMCIPESDFAPEGYVADPEESLTDDDFGGSVKLQDDDIDTVKLQDDDFTTVKVEDDDSLTTNYGKVGRRGSPAPARQRRVRR